MAPQIGGRPRRKSAPPAPPAPSPLSYLRVDGGFVAVVRRAGEGPDGKALVRLGVPGLDGVFRFSDNSLAVDPADLFAGDLPSDLPHEVAGGVKRWAGGAGFTAAAEGSKAVAVRDADSNVVVDYRGVTIDGYLSTFREFTASDRDGEYVVPGAFDATLHEFAKNPVMLMDHENSVTMLAGSYTSLTADRKGLHVVGAISDAPGLIDVRFKLVEGHLKTLSMGGVFYHGDDYAAIELVDLWEGSLIPIPANQDAIFSTRDIGLDDVKAQVSYVRKAGKASRLVASLLAA